MQTKLCGKMINQFNYCIFGGGEWNWGLNSGLAKQVFYPLSHTSNPFATIYLNVRIGHGILSEE
jgi:hypothetical protein